MNNNNNIIVINIKNESFKTYFGKWEFCTNPSVADERYEELANAVLTPASAIYQLTWYQYKAELHH